jgi:hypothetical protein
MGERRGVSALLTQESGILEGENELWVTVGKALKVRKCPL